MIQDNMRIRPMTASDAPSVGPLIYAAIGDLGEFFTGAKGRDEAIERLTQLVTLQNNRFSYPYGLCIDLLIEGQWVLAAVGSAYDADGIDQLTENTIMQAKFMGWSLDSAIEQRLRLEREAPLGTYYIDHLAVDSDFRGRALGTSMLEALIKRGKALGFSQISLLVDATNPKAQSLYERLGFKLDGPVKANGHLYHAMIYGGH